jgi:hypothetical protein
MMPFMVCFSSVIIFLSFAVAVVDIKELVIGKDCPHVKDKKNKVISPDNFDKQILFSLSTKAANAFVFFKLPLKLSIHVIPSHFAVSVMSSNVFTIDAHRHDDTDDGRDSRASRSSPSHIFCVRSNSSCVI